MAKSRKLVPICSMAVATLSSGVSLAVPIEQLYPLANGTHEPICYMVTEKNVTLDLSSLCGLSSVSTPTTVIHSSANVSPPFSSNRATGGVSRVYFPPVSRPSLSSSGFSSGGSCPTPDSRDARGNRCGGRAASVRSGGR